MKLFEKNHTIEIILPANAPEALQLAADDLQDNLRHLSGQEGFPIVKKSTDAHGIWIQTLEEGTPESYTICIDDEKVLITGADTLGTVFGIYAFATNCLNILPVYRLVDIFPKECESLTLSPKSFSSAPRKIRFRGWFLNDEDLLTDFKEGGGHRHIDYRYYQNVMAPDVLDMILETALRMEINLVIPSSFVDIDNPDEEKLVQAVTRRGMYISQHHVEPVGVSYFAADAYMKKHGKEDEAVSFISNRERMEEIWRYYIKKWAKYGNHVIWQFGLRGKADHAVWESDPNVPMDAGSRGAVITDAIATQYRIVREVLGKTDFYSTVTLWLEGAALYGKGYLKIPDSTVIVFSDIGLSQMFGDDFYQVERRPAQRYGIYYHVGYWGEGPHLAEGCDLRKMVFSYREAWEQKSLYYSIVNVSNVRPLHFSVWFNAELLQNPVSFSEEQTLDSLLTALFAEAAAEVKPLMKAYYDTIADLGKQELYERCVNRDFYYHDYGTLTYPEFPATDGVLCYIGKKILTEKYYVKDDERFAEVIGASLEKWQELYERMQEAVQKLPESCRIYFGQFLKFETFYMMQLTRWLLSCRALMHAVDEETRAQAKSTAVGALTSILEERKILETGAWKDWHRGDKKIGITDLVKLTEETYRNKAEG